MKVCLNRIVFVIGIIITSGCASYEHYFEPHSPDGTISRSLCGFGPRSILTLKVTYHNLNVSASRSFGDIVTTSDVHYPISRSIVLVEINSWLNWNETLSMDPSKTIALDSQKRSLPIIMPSFIYRAFISPVEPKISGKLVQNLLTAINGQISFEAPDTHKNTTVAILIEVEVGSLKEFSIQLPPITLSGFEYHFPEITFQEKEGMFFVPAFNC